MDEPKKPGPRDISDLKARLGLKKPAAAGGIPGMAPPPGATPPAGMPSVGGGLPPPPGMQQQQQQPYQPQGGGPPPPFGRAAEAPPAPQAPPDPRRDPFAQQQQANLAAFYGYGQALPGSAEGVADTPIEKPKPLGRYAALAGVGLVVFVLGSAWGSISNDRKGFNEATDQAGIIRSEVDVMAKNLSSVLETINASKETAKGNPDFDMTAKLGALDLRKPDTRKLFHINYYHLDPMIVERLFTYYMDSLALYDQIAVHAKKTDGDKEAISNYLKSGAGKSEKNFGVTMDMSAAIPVAHLVEVGSPVCQKEGVTDCKTSELKGFKYRADTGLAWSERPFKGKPGETVTPLQETPLFHAVMAGNPDFLAVKDYARRVNNIRGLSAKLLAEQKDVVGDMKRAAERPHLFTL